MMALAVPFALAEKSQEDPGEDIAQEQLHTRCVVGQKKTHLPVKFRSRHGSDSAGPQALT